MCYIVSQKRDPITNGEDYGSMTYYRKLGLFTGIPTVGEAKTWFVPPLAEQDAAALSLAFLEDLSARLEKLKKVSGTVFHVENDIESIRNHVPRNYTLVVQKGETPGERMINAFKMMLSEERDIAVVIGTDSPDVPLKYIKRAFLKLKHKEVVIGPNTNGGLYMIGLKSPAQRIFENINWDPRGVLEQTLKSIANQGFSLSLLPMWYNVSDFASLSLLRTMMQARILEKSGRLLSTEKAMTEIFKKKDK
jgi:rSAM/selenodomain-associated transferase 1